MFRYRRWTALAAGSVIATASLAGCSAGDGAASDGPVALDFAYWGNDVRAEMYEESIALFEEEHPDIDVRATFLGFAEFWEKRQTEAAGGGLPDVMQFSEQYLRQYGEAGLLLPLDPFLGDPLQTDTLSDEVLALGVFDGQTLGIATSTNTWASFYNLGLLEELDLEPFAGGTWDEYNTWVAEATAAGADAGVFGGSDWTVGFRNFELQLRAEGGNLFTDDGEPGFDRERLAAFWEQGTALRDGAAVSAQRVEELSPLTPFDSAVTASELQWDNFGASYVQNLGVEPEHIALVAPPTLIEGSKDMFLKSSMMYTIAANTEHPDEAALLIDFLVNDPEVGEIFGTNRGLPASSTQLAGMELGPIETQVQQYEASITDRLGDPPPLPVSGQGSLEEKFRQLGVELGFGTLTIPEAVDQFFIEMDVVLG